MPLSSGFPRLARGSRHPLVTLGFRRETSEYPTLWMQPSAATIVDPAGGGGGEEGGGGGGGCYAMKSLPVQASFHFSLLEDDRLLELFSSSLCQFSSLS